MKKTLILLCLILFSFKAQAQPIIPIEETNNYIQNNGILPDNTYLKDINNILDNYTGSWKGTHQNKSYFFTITKKTGYFNDVVSIKSDGLVIRFRITDNNTGQVLYDKFKLQEEFHLTNSRYREVTKDKYSMIYYGDVDEKIDCGDIGDMYLELFENNEKLKVYVKPDFVEIWIVDGVNPCPQGVVRPPFPDKEEDALILVKQKSTIGSL